MNECNGGRSFAQFADIALSIRKGCDIALPGHIRGGQECVQNSGHIGSAQSAEDRYQRGFPFAAWFRVLFSSCVLRRIKARIGIYRVLDICDTT